MDATILDGIAQHDSLFISVHKGDVALACPGRLLAEQRQGLSTLVVTLHRQPDDEAFPDPVFRLKVDRFLAGMAAAPERDEQYKRPHVRLFGRRPGEDEVGAALVHLFADLARRVRARQVYLPLGIGGDIDHRLVHDAATRTFPSATGQNVFFYEERPDAFVPGSVRLRLGQLATRLPPAITDIGDRAGFVRFILGAQRQMAFEPGTRGARERLWHAWTAYREWRWARVWQPRKAFGLRLQPLVHELDASDVAVVRDLAGAAQRSSGIRSCAAFMAAAEQYSRRLASAPLSERYWLLLPTLEHDAQLALSQDVDG